MSIGSSPMKYMKQVNFLTGVLELSSKISIVELIAMLPLNERYSEDVFFFFIVEVIIIDNPKCMNVKYNRY